MSDFAIIVAVDAELGIGLAGGLPWKLPGDMAYFKRLTIEAPDGLRNAVIMGRKTYESIPVRFRPLAQRLNIVLTRSGADSPAPGVLTASSLEAALALLAGHTDLHHVFVIGGGDVYRQALTHPRCSTLYVTRVHDRFGCDTHFPEFQETFRLVTETGIQHDDGIAYRFEVYERV
jgi:dihydrofolate reductase